MSIKRSNNNTIRAFAARVQTYAAQIDGTNYEVKSKALARRCTKGLGSSFKSINKMVNETVIIPDGQSKKFPLCQLVDKALPYLRARLVKDADNKKKDKKKKTE